jgi:hypothetical protein
MSKKQKTKLPDLKVGDYVRVLETATTTDGKMLKGTVIKIGNFKSTGSTNPLYCGKYFHGYSCTPRNESGIWIEEVELVVKRNEGEFIGVGDYVEVTWLKEPGRYGRKQLGEVYKVKGIERAGYDCNEETRLLLEDNLGNDQGGLYLSRVSLYKHKPADLQISPEEIDYYEVIKDFPRFKKGTKFHTYPGGERQYCGEDYNGLAMFLSERDMSSDFFKPVYKKETLPTICGYQGVDDGDCIKFGCAKISKSTFTALAEIHKTTGTSSNRSISKITLDSNVEISMDNIIKIAQFINKNK